MKRAFIGLGSNLDSRLHFLRQALRVLRLNDRIRVRSHSPIYESQALLPEDGDLSWNIPFLNFVIEIETSWSPIELLKVCKGIEDQLGRKNRGKWAPREIDLDILLFEDQHFRSESLQLPHPEILNRPFALLPLNDLNPGASLWGPLQPRVQEQIKTWRAKGVPFETKRFAKGFTEVVGVLNLTPDSFSDGGRFENADHALAHFEKLVQSGADVIDIGAESTRPGSRAIDSNEEWARLNLTLSEIMRRCDRRVQISVDTRHAQTATRALSLGVDWINDVTGFDSDLMKSALRDSNAKVVAMHHLGLPPHADIILSRETSSVDQLLEWGFQKIDSLVQNGIAKSRIILDPGFGFGKSPDQHREIISGIQSLHEWQVPILIGHSRKSFLTRWFPETLTGAAEQRDIETLALSDWFFQNGIDYVRVHDVHSTARAFSVRSLIQNQYTNHIL